MTRHAAHSSVGERLLAELVYAVDVAGRLGLAATNAIDGYLDVADLAGAVSRHGLIRDDEGRVTLRATTMDMNVVRDLAQCGAVLAALDLAESLDARERRVGLDALAEIEAALPKRSGERSTRGSDHPGRLTVISWAVPALARV